MIIAELSNPSNLKKYLEFFPFFKTLSKMCHLAMTERKIKNARANIRAIESQLIEKANKVRENQKLAETQNFYVTIDEERARLENDELPMIQAKLEKINVNLEAVNERLANFNETYWAIPEVEAEEE